MLIKELLKEVEERNIKERRRRKGHKKSEVHNSEGIHLFSYGQKVFVTVKNNALLNA